MSHQELMNPTNAKPGVDFPALLGRCLGNFKIVERALSTFRTTGQADLDQLQQAIESGDFPAVAAISHRFQGAAGNVSAVGLCQRLQYVEQLAQQRNHAELLMILGQLRPEWDDFERSAQAIAPTSGTFTRDPAPQAQGVLEASHASPRC